MKHRAAFFAAMLLVGACAEPEVLLDGKRLDVRTPVGQTENPTVDFAPVTSVSLPQARSIASWGHRNSSPTHVVPNALINSNLSQIWSTSIGEPESKRARISTDPVSDGVRIFTMDASARVSATALNGQAVWAQDLTPPNEKPGLVSGGNVTVAGGTLYASSAYGTLHAFNAATGQLRWQQKLDAAPSGPPTIVGDVVYLVSRDNKAWAIEAGTGRVRWQLDGLPAVAAFDSGASPAVTGKIAVFPFSSGEVIAVLRQGGVRLWSGTVSGRRIGRVYSSIGDFASDPVIVGNTVYASTQSGRTAAIDLASGKRKWTAPLGALGSMVVSGGSLWMISDAGDLVRLNAATGQPVWSQPLPYFTEEKLKRRRGIHAHYGPILANGRILVAGSDGALRTFDATTGQQLSQTALPNGAASAPIVVGQTLYLVTSDGNLRAFR